MHAVTASSLREPQKLRTDQNSSWKEHAKTISLIIAPFIATYIFTGDSLISALLASGGSAATLCYWDDSSEHSFFKDLDNLQTIGNISPQIHANLTAQSINLTSSKFQDYVNSLTQSSVFRKPVISKSTATSILNSYDLAKKNKLILSKIYAKEKISTNRNSNLWVIPTIISLTLISMNSLYNSLECQSKIIYIASLFPQKTH